jgi:hypothetical protein
MKTYEFYGTVRVEAETEDKAIEIFDSKMAGFDTNIQEVYEVE